jgi:hypothetical protein
VAIRLLKSDWCCEVKLNYFRLQIFLMIGMDILQRLAETAVITEDFPQGGPLPVPEFLR